MWPVLAYKMPQKDERLPQTCYCYGSKIKTEQLCAFEMAIGVMGVIERYLLNQEDCQFERSWDV